MTTAMRQRRAKKKAMYCGGCFFFAPHMTVSKGGGLSPKEGKRGKKKKTSSKKKRIGSTKKIEKSTRINEQHASNGKNLVENRGGRNGERRCRGNKNQLVGHDGHAPDRTNKNVMKRALSRRLRVGGWGAKGELRETGSGWGQRISVVKGGVNWRRGEGQRVPDPVGE